MPLSPRSARRTTGSRSPNTSGYLAFKDRNEACASGSLRCDDTCTRNAPSAPANPDGARVAGGLAAATARPWATLASERGAPDDLLGPARGDGFADPTLGSASEGLI